MVERVEKEVIFKKKSNKKFVYLDKYEDKVEQLEESISRLNKQVNISYIAIGILLLFVIFK